jgi:hypothetical protein
LRIKGQYLLLILVFSTILTSCFLKSRLDAGNIECKNVHVDENIYRVVCNGKNDVNPVAVQSAFEDYSTKVCRDNGFGYYALSNEPPPLSTSYAAIIECTNTQ